MSSSCVARGKVSRLFRTTCTAVAVSPFRCSHQDRPPPRPPSRRELGLRHSPRLPPLPLRPRSGSQASSSGPPEPFLVQPDPPHPHYKGPQRAPRRPCRPRPPSPPSRGRHRSCRSRHSQRRPVPGRSQWQLIPSPSEWAPSRGVVGGKYLGAKRRRRHCGVGSRSLVLVSGRRSWRLEDFVDGRTSI